MVAIFLAGSSFHALAQAERVDAGLIDTCRGCHAAGGNGTNSSAPRLNGQLAPYIIYRLRELTDLTRNSVQATMAMHDVAHMKENQKTAVAEYFASQPPTAAQPQPGQLAAMGKRLYLNGDPPGQLPACQSCHGAEADGNGNVPRLAGQRREYLRNQLWNFNFVMREHATMNANAIKLNPDQINSLVAYLGAD